MKDDFAVGSDGRALGRSERDDDVRLANQTRAVVCVNALRGVAEPEAVVKAAFAAIHEIVNSPHQVYDNHKGGQYGVGVADGHRCAANMARAALALLTPPAAQGSGKETTNGM